MDNEIRFWDRDYADQAEAQAKLDAARVALAQTRRDQAYIETVLERFPNMARARERQARLAEFAINRMAHVEFWEGVVQ